jgi:LysR family transcriptional regulator, positive regulator for ilvC
MVSIADLSMVVDAADSQNLGSVARARHVSQSTVSRSVQRIEAALGQPLFVREGRAVFLAPDVTPLVDGIRDIVDRWNDLVGVASLQSDESLSIYCTVTASQTIVPELLSSFRRLHPSIRLRLQTGPASAALDAVLDGSVDAAIAPLPNGLPKALWAAEVATTPLIAVCSPDVRMWADQRIILPKQGLTRELAERWCRRSLPSFEVQETDSHEEVVALAALGSGIGIVPRLVVETSALRQRLRELAPPKRLPMMRLGLVVRARDRALPAVAALCSMVPTAT